jgi:hypothetical protein
MSFSAMRYTIEKLTLKIKIIVDEKLSDDMKLLFNKQVKITSS